MSESVRRYVKPIVQCPTCDEPVPLYRGRIATHGWPTCSGTGQKPQDLP